MDEPKSPSLQQTDGERIAEELKRWGSFLPIVGTFFVPLVDHVLPTRHLQRVALYVQNVSRRVSALEDRLRDLESEELSEDQRVLFEVGARDASSATSDRRVEQIADIVVPGLVGASAATDGLLTLRTLALLDDEEIEMLAGYGRRMVTKWFLREPDMEQRKRDEWLLLGGDRSKDPAHYARLAGAVLESGIAPTCGASPIEEPYRGVPHDSWGNASARAWPPPQTRPGFFAHSMGSR